MARRKVRHALVQYTVTKDGATVFETAFRNQVVDIPDDQVDRFDELGATVDPDATLERPGTMDQLSEMASDSEILNWVMGATNDEVTALAAARPVMAGRILSAHQSVLERFAEQDAHLGGLQKIADDYETELASLLGDGDSDDDKNDDGGGDAGKASSDGDDTLSDEDADKIVDGNVELVTEYISKNPAHAQLILDAEGRRAMAKNIDVRVGVTKAAEAAIGFTQ